MLTLLRINRSFMEFMRKHYGHMPMAGFEPKYAKYGKAGRVHEPSCSFIRSPPVVVNRYHWLWHFFAKFGMCACRVMSQKAQKARPEKSQRGVNLEYWPTRGERKRAVPAVNPDE